MNSLSVCRKTQIARAYATFFVAASFFIEGTTATQNAYLARQAPNSPGIQTLFRFLPVSNATTCEALEFSWVLTGSGSSVAFFATNSGVAQQPPTPTSTTRYNTETDGDNVVRALPTGANDPTQILTVPVANDVLPSKGQYSWTSVDIPQGWYQLIASLSTPASLLPVTSTSSSFFVSTGPDTSCLSFSSPTNTATTQTGSQSTSTGASTASTPTHTIALPVGGASTSSTNTRLIVGVTIGAVVIAAAALAAWFWLHKTRQRTKGGAASPSHVPRRWNGLGSTDSRGGFMGDTSTRRQYLGSMGTIPMSPSEEAVSKAEKHSINSKFGEGSPFDDGPGLALATMPALQQHQAPRSRSLGVARTYSMSSSISNGLSPNEFGAVAPPGRRPSVPDSFIGRQSTESTGYPPSPSSPSSGIGGRNSALFIPAPALSRSHSLSTSATHQTSMMGHTGFLPGGSSQSTSSHAGLLYQTSRQTPSPQPEVSTPTSPASPAAAADAATKQANRRSFGATKRKPVPTYNADDELGGSLTPPVPSLSSTPIPPPSPVPDHMPHYLTRSQAGQDYSQPELVHKSSFGPGGIEGKPLHYLMPDMPMSLKD